jgi:hypothetical protein
MAMTVRAVRTSNVWYLVLPLYAELVALPFDAVRPSCLPRLPRTVRRKDAHPGLSRCGFPLALASFRMSAKLQTCGHDDTRWPTVGAPMAPNWL